MTDAPRTFPPLVVSTDAAAVTRAFRFPIVLSQVMIVLTAAAAIAIVVGVSVSTGDLGTGLLSSLVVLWPVYFTFMTVYLMRAARKRASLGSVLTLDSAGMEWRMPQGTVVVPWHVVGSVTARSRGRHRILTYRLVDGATGETTGVRSDLDPALFRRLTKRGLQIGSAGIDVDVDTILAATAAFTQGRLALR
jgi:hypothetical protein